MNIVIIKHISYEGPDYILDIIKKYSLKYKIINIYKNEKLPELNSFDALVIMGGPMGVYEEDKFPWLIKEKIFIKKAIQHKKKILGICLGAQLIAECMGAKVYKNEYSEIGWFPVFLTKRARSNFIFKNLPKKFLTFHWHNDTFTLPKGLIHLASSYACKNQAFMLGRNIIGLQFHPEIKLKSLKTFINKFYKKLEKGKYVQKYKKLVPNKKIIKQNNEIIDPIISGLIFNQIYT